MLSMTEVSTIRAALRFWLDEIVPHQPSGARPYLDASIIETLDRDSVIELIDRFAPDALRYVAVDIDSKKIDPCMLLKAEQVRDIPLGSVSLHTVVTNKT